MIATCRHLALAAALVLPLATHAQSTDWHIGVGAVGAMDDRAPYDFNVDSDADNGATFVAGIRFDNGFGVEAGYVDLGNVVAIGIADAGFDLDGELWSVGATWGWRFDQLEPYVKLGWFTREEDGITIGIAGPTPVSFSDDGVMAEAGLRWHVTEPFALRLGYTHYDFEREADGAAQLLAEWHF
jgi:opacity protein-like surface antigen